MYISYEETVMRLLLATVLGMIFGLERARNRKPAGTRTHVLVCLAACMIAIVSAYGFGDSVQYYPDQVNVNIDPARLVVGMLTGIGFLGAGIIWKSPSGGVQGITTAAEIFLLTALGIATGLGQYFLVAATAIIAIVTMAADNIWSRMKRRRHLAGPDCSPKQAAGGKDAARDCNEESGE